MAGDDAAVVKVEPGESCALCADILVARSVESVTTDAVFFVILIRKRVHIGVVRHRLVECGVEDCDLRNGRKSLRHSVDSEEICRIVERGNLAALANLRNHFVRHKGTAEKLLSAMHHAVSHSLDVVKRAKASVFLVQQRVKHSLNADGVVLNRHFAHKFLLSGSLMLETSYLKADALDESLREKVIDIVVLHVQQLILQRRAAAVEH